MVLIIFFVLISPANALSFNFTSFNDSIRDLKYEGDASLVDSAIQLTENLPELTGHVTYLEPLHLWDETSGNLASFIINFTFSIDDQNNASHSDGIALYLAHLDYQIPDIQQGSGIGLASGNQTLNSTDNPFVAVEFDTFHNAWDEDDGDHVGIDISSLRSSQHTRWYSSLDGRITEAGISYNSSSKNLCVYFTGITEGIIIPQVLCLEIDLRNHLPEWVVVGFSAATGMFSEFHTIHSWSCNSYFSSLPLPPSSSSPPQPPSSSSPPPSQIPLRPPKNDRYKVLMIVGWSVAGLFLAILIVGVILFFIFKNRPNTIEGQNPVPGHYGGGGTEPGPPQNQFSEIENDTAINQNREAAGNAAATTQIARNLENGSAIVQSRRIENEVDSAQSRIEVQNREETQIDSSSAQSTREIGVDSSSVRSSDIC